LASSHPDAVIDGIDLYEGTPPGYRRVWTFDLNRGLPDDCGPYDLVCCCEGLEHVGNPLLLLQAIHDRLLPGGRIVVTTPNVWYLQARLQYFARGFFPSFPCLVGKIVYGSHMHIMPWTWPQLHLYLKLAGFHDIQLIPEPLSAAKHLHEKILCLPSHLYSRRRALKSRTDEEREFWRTTASKAAHLSRHLIVTARPVSAPQPAQEATRKSEPNKKEYRVSDSSLVEETPAVPALTLGP
jgi:SAM-dependent methyltransferase